MGIADCGLADMDKHGRTRTNMDGIAREYAISQDSLVLLAWWKEMVKALAAMV